MQACLSLIVGEMVTEPIMTRKWTGVFSIASKNILNLDFTLSSGQSFRWDKTPEGKWIGVIRDCVWILNQDEDGKIKYEIIAPGPQGSEKNTSKPSRKRKRSDGTVQNGLIASPNNQQHDLEPDDVFRTYFQLHIDLEHLCSTWIAVDENFKSVASKINGVRILRQDPLENLFSFICSSNNNIPRIKSMVEKLCSEYGREISQVDGKSYFSFPLLKSLVDPGVEANLRRLGFGYRAKFISQCAQYIEKNHGPQWLDRLRDLPYEEVHTELRKLPGVGAKVADCICLMSMDKPQAIPVDTHVWQIATKQYLPHLKSTKSLTDKVYKEIGDYFRQKFGEYAGWAHSVLFCGDLKTFKDEMNSSKGRCKI